MNLNEFYLLKMSNGEYLYRTQDMESQDVVFAGTLSNPVDADKMTEFEVDEVIKAIQTGSRLSGLQRDEVVPDVFELELYEENLKPVSKIHAKLVVLSEEPIE